MNTTKPKRQRTEKRVGTYWQKPPPITRSEAIAAQRDRGTYLDAAKIAEAAVRAGILKLPTKREEL